MVNETSGLKRFSEMGVGAIMLISIAAMPTTIQNGYMSNKYTLCTNQIYDYNSAVIINDSDGGLCLSSDFFDRTSGNIMVMYDMEGFVAVHPRKNIKLNITKIAKHISDFDFEEEYEEL